MDSTNKCILIFSVIFCLASVQTRKIPSYISLCHQDDPNIIACFGKAVEQIRPHLLKGIPELGIPSLNPLVLPQAGLDNGDNFRALFRNIEIYYAEEFQVNKLIVDLPKDHIELSLTFPRLRIKSQYEVDGRILILQLKGSGPADGNFTNVVGNLVIDGERYEKNGKQFVKLAKKTLDLKLGKPVFQFDNLFRDNRELNDQTNKIINENIVDIIDELRPVVYETVSQFIFGVVERVFNRFSFDELFPK